MKEGSNLNSVMVAGDHSNNKTRLKSPLMGKRNFLLNICSASWVAAALILLTGCDGFGNIGTVKSSILRDLDHSITIGDALDKYKYFTKTEWKEFKTDQGRKIVEFNGFYNKWDAVVTIQFLLNVDLDKDEEGVNFRLSYVGMHGINSDGIINESGGNMETLKWIWKNKGCIGESSMRTFVEEGEDPPSRTDGYVSVTDTTYFETVDDAVYAHAWEEEMGIGKKLRKITKHGKVYRGRYLFLYLHGWDFMRDES
jgi:hypothetical protein